MWDREALLAAVDLHSLADELLGPHAGSDRSPSWPCPHPDHPQTGRTPPLTIFEARTGGQRWHCHGCGNRGTAIDLVMQVRGVDIRDALNELARRSGLPTDQLQRTGNPRPKPATQRADAPSQPPSPKPNPALDAYVTQCAQMLWRPEAEPIRRWLTDTRRLPAEILHTNKVGADLGPARQRRPPGIPAVRRAVVLPVLVDGAACYLQLRLLGARYRKYLNPRSDLYTNPRLGLYEPVQPFDGPRNERIVTEGIIDALSATAGGYPAAAVLSASYGDPTVALTLSRLPGQLVVAFDPDPAGRHGAERLVQLLNAHHRPPGVMVLRNGDLNQNLAKAEDWPLELAGRVQHATYRPGLLPPRSLAPAIG